MDRTRTRELYRIELPNGRAAEISADQIRRITRGMGEHLDELLDSDSVPPMVQALESLPLHQRADALSVALRRFGDKQDVETISHICGLSAWQVWQLEEALRQAMLHVRAHESVTQLRLQAQRASSTAARLMSPDMLANAIAHGEAVDLEAEHEASLRAAER